MTPAEIAELLTFCAAFDRRTVGRSDALAWHQVLGDLEFADARQAVADHYAEHRDWIMPADIRQRVRALRSARIAAAHPVYDGQPEETGAQSAEAIRALHRAAADGQVPARPIRAALGPGDARPSPRTVALLATVGRRIPTTDQAAQQPQIGVNPLAVPCPHCTARPGAPCSSRRRARRTDVHPSRLDAARAAAAGRAAPDQAERHAEEQRRIAAASHAAPAPPAQAAP